MFASVFITSPDLKSAKKISSVLVKKKLAACANYFSTTSMYRWKERIEHSEEYIIILKIRSADFKQVSEEVKKVHPYKVPCIVKYSITEGSLAYLDWVKESTDRTPED